MHKRYSSPSLRERGVQFSRAPSQSMSTCMPGYGTSAIIAMDKTSSISSVTSLVPKSKSLGKNSERSLESVLHASKQKVLAIESLLKGIGMSDKQNLATARSTSLDLGILEMLTFEFSYCIMVYSLLIVRSRFTLCLTFLCLSKLQKLSYLTSSCSWRRC